MDDNSKLLADVHDWLSREKAYYDWLYEGAETLNNDRYLTDFSQAWKSSPDLETIPQWMAEEWKKVQQKQTATTVSIGNGPTYISASEGSDRLTLHGGTGYIPILVGEIDEVIAALQRLRTLLKPVAGPTSSTQRSAPAYETRPNHPGYVSQAEKNDRELKRALGIDY